ncbi:MAG: tryptophan 2,3-dioxygenase [Acidimicrobiia bacterium BACL6 MAG-120924-bin43]|jgi:tryptophan 2,3-dioxygenase|uniref:Tryptophan 2,3-dioxygenase n=1 Tax=Acidimicrobiia bacterium BACL6 MAG-120924-bin43 TaxID=1655583 RepID=A0A0R2QI16_9ACTN|nr:MAG: tryptophan 2,3-dioxygenase [Acidimicrobiia bacterium BACL6 MAG-120924-bin43]KRO52854.1 MAG: tryptophan 2,3-dioxygenase [Acidimicrobiia bacterium BACL6 MAG-120910-bin40]
MPNTQPAITYTSYLKIEEILQLQQPLSNGPEHDELLFIIIHQSYELWFKSIHHELARAQDVLEEGDTHTALGLLGRVRTILKVLVSQVDILETMTPLQFNSFRDRLEAASGFQSAQFRELEAVFGRRDDGMIDHLPVGDQRDRVGAAMKRRSLWDSVLRYLIARGHHVPDEIINRDMTIEYVANKDVQRAIANAYRSDPETALLLERLVDIDEGLQEWRYRHVKMVERTIGHKIGSGGSSGASYLASTLFKPVFPDLWDVRSTF